MNAKSPKKAKAATGSAENVKQQARQKLDQAKEKIGLGQLFKDLWESVKKGNGEEALGKVTAIITALFAGKLATLKEEVEKGRKKAAAKTADEKAPEAEKGAEPSKKAEEKELIVDESTLENVKPQAATSISGLPEGIEMKNGKPLYNKENVLKCKTIEQCRALMKANGFVLDEGSGNYINPRYITPSKILKEPLVKSKIGTKMITLKRSVMIRLKKADASLFAETGEHIKMHQHFRPNSLQLSLYHKLKPKNARVASPGHSFHEIGQAIDVSNWEKASKHLWNQGFVGGKRPIGLKGDANHFSIKEIGVNPKRKAALEKEIGKPWEKVA